MSVSVPVSVVIPSYNSARYLRTCLESINSATVIPTEIIVVDDCSTDGSFEYATQLLSQFDNCKILRTEVNSGAAAARKIGFLNAKEDLVAIVDADDRLEEGAILDAFERTRGGADLCIWELWSESINGNLWKHEANPARFPLSGDEAVLLSLGEWRIHPLGVARRDLYLNAYREIDNSGFDICGCLNADELITRIVLKNSKEIIASKYRYFYRKNPSSTTQKLSKRHLSMLRSKIWLAQFSAKLPHAPYSSLVRDSTAYAWFCWRNRKFFGFEDTYAELRSFLSSAQKMHGYIMSLAKSPRHFAVFVLLSIFCTQRRILKA